jgi:hypothetical protein
MKARKEATRKAKTCELDIKMVLGEIGLGGVY